MTLTPMPQPTAIIEVAPHGTQWLLTSSDRLFSGLFLDRRTACQHADAEAEAHPGHVMIIRDR